MVASGAFGFTAAACPRVLALVPDATLGGASILAALATFLSGELFTEGFLMTLFFARAVDMGPPYTFLTSAKDIGGSFVHLTGKRLKPAAASLAVGISDHVFVCVRVCQTKGNLRGGRTYWTSPAQKLQYMPGQSVGKSTWWNCQMREEGYRTAV